MFTGSVSSYGSQYQVNGTIPAPGPKALEPEEPPVCLTPGALSVLTVRLRAGGETASVTKAAKESG